MLDEQDYFLHSDRILYIHEHASKFRADADVDIKYTQQNRLGKVKRSLVSAVGKVCCGMYLFAEKPIRQAERAAKRISKRVVRVFKSATGKRELTLIAVWDNCSHTAASSKSERDTGLLEEAGLAFGVFAARCKKLLKRSVNYAGPVAAALLLAAVVRANTVYSVGFSLIVNGENIANLRTMVEVDAALLKAAGALGWDDDILKDNVDVICSLCHENDYAAVERASDDIVTLKQHDSPYKPTIRLLADSVPLAEFAGEDPDEDMSYEEYSLTESYVSRYAYKIAPVTSDDYYRLTTALTVSTSVNFDSDVVDGYGVAVNGVVIACTATEAEANAAIQKIKDYYTRVKYDTMYVEEKLTPVKGMYPPSAITDEAGAYGILKSNVREAVYYTLEQGDTMYRVAMMYGLYIEDLEVLNPHRTRYNCVAGDTLLIAGAAPVVNVVAIRRDTEEIELPYETITEQTAALLKGKTETKIQGQNGLAVITNEITYVNGAEISNFDIEAKVIKETVNKYVLEGTKVEAKSNSSNSSSSSKSSSNATPASTGTYAWPLAGGYNRSSNFGMRNGRMHTGIDLSCKKGTPILAADGGVVEFTGYSGGYGNYIIIKHKNGDRTYYAHCSVILSNIKAGVSVAKGEKIAAVGSTGNSTGPHLHFEIRVNGTAVNPMNYLK